MSEDTAPPPEDHPFYKKSDEATISRESIKPAKYNPRQIDLNAKVKLKNGVRRFGMVERLVWNKRNGNLVGGHQRLKLMDEELGRDHGYGVKVTVVDLDDIREKELNMLLNSEGAQGWWDWNQLAHVIAETPGIDVEMAGFDKIQLKSVLETNADLTGLDFKHVFGDLDKPDDAAADAETIRSMKAGKEEYQQVSNELTQDGFYIMLVARTTGEKEKFCEAIGVNPLAKNAELRVVAKALGIDIGYVEPADPDMSTPDRGDDDGEDDPNEPELGNPIAGRLGAPTPFDAPKNGEAEF